MTLAATQVWVPRKILRSTVIVYCRYPVSTNTGEIRGAQAGQAKNVQDKDSIWVKQATNVRSVPCKVRSR